MSNADTKFTWSAEYEYESRDGTRWRLYDIVDEETVFPVVLERPGIGGSLKPFTLRGRFYDDRREDNWDIVKQHPIAPPVAETVPQWCRALFAELCGRGYFNYQHKEESITGKEIIAIICKHSPNAQPMQAVNDDVKAVFATVKEQAYKLPNKCECSGSEPCVTCELLARIDDLERSLELARHAPKAVPQQGVEEAAEVEQLKAKLADEELICLRVIQDRDAAVEFCDLFASTILGEDINWSCHETKWQEALDMLSNGKTIEVSGIMLRRSGDYAIVEAEVDGKWREVISEFIDAPFSHIVEPAGILQSKESELNAVPDGVEAQPQPAPRYACSKLAAVGDRVKFAGKGCTREFWVTAISPTGMCDLLRANGKAEASQAHASSLEFVPDVTPAAPERDVPQEIPQWCYEAYDAAMLQSLRQRGAEAIFRHAPKDAADAPDTTQPTIKRPLPITPTPGERSLGQLLYETLHGQVEGMKPLCGEPYARLLPESIARYEHAAAAVVSHASKQREFYDIDAIVDMLDEAVSEAESTPLAKPDAATKWPRYFESKDARHDKSLRRVYHADGTCGWQDGNGSPMSTTLSEALQDDYMIETDADGNELKQPIAETKPVVAKYRSKPCVIEAIHYKGTKASFDAIYDWMDGDNVGSANLGYRGPSEHDPQEFGIKTLEGSMIATPGDWIIKGTHGEFYACKPEVFAVKYELVEATQPIPGEVAKVEHDHDQELAADHDAAIANAQAVTRENLAIIAAKDAEIAELRKQVESLECEVYCPTCGGCGCEGCCSPNNCQIVKCKYPHNVETWEENMKAIEDATKRAERAEAEAGILADNLTLREQEIAEAKDELSICKNGNAILDTQNEQLRTKLAEVEKERDEANRTVNIVLSSLRWTGDGYEWTGGQFDYRMNPSDAVAATQGLLHKLRSAKKDLTAQLAAANERVAAVEKEQNGLREVLDSCRAEVRCLYRQASGKDPSEATGSVRNVLERIQNAFALSQTKGWE